MSSTIPDYFILKMEAVVLRYSESLIATHQSVRYQDTEHYLLYTYLLIYLFNSRQQSPS